MHTSRWPCGAVSLSGVTAERDGAARLSRQYGVGLNSMSAFCLKTYHPLIIIIIIIIIPVIIIIPGAIFMVLSS